MSFPWLNARSHFSVGESLAEPAALAKTADQLGLSGILLSDTMSVSGMPELFTSASKLACKPMIGVRLRVVRGLEKDKAAAKKDQPMFLRALVLDQRGWDATLGLLSRAFDDDHFYSVPRLLLADVIAAYAPGGAALTLGDTYGALSQGRGAEVVKACRDAGIPLYAETTLTPTPLGVRLFRDALFLQSFGVPTLIAPLALYDDASQADTLDLMASIARNMPLDDLSPRHPYREHHLQEWERLRRRLAVMVKLASARYGAGMDWTERVRVAIESTRAFPSLVSFAWRKMPVSLPKMADDEFAELVGRCRQGWRSRFAGEVFGHRPTLAEQGLYAERLAHELKVIRSLGFAAYFLLVADVVNWAKSQGIRVGPGRGSVGGSLIAYLIGITDVDPIRFGLLFERFINPERIDLPDADLDFASLRRDEVVRYLKDRFGEDYVGGVVNYNSMQAAGALKDVCRMLGVENTGPAFSKIVPKEHGESWSIEQAIAEVPELAAFASRHPEVIQHARALEGKVRAFGKHAAGMIVAGVPLRERAVVERRNGDAVINWDKRLAEDFGLVKLDVLGLSTLDMLDISLRLIRGRRGRSLDLLTIPLDDAKTLDAFGRGETVGVFQFESAGMRRLLCDLAEGGRLSFEDLAVATALYRPGPMDSGLMEDFIKIRQGKKVETYDHPSMREALRETRGVMVYQEQVMQVARDFAGFSMPESDTLRKAMGKKSKDLMAKFKEKFLDGAVLMHGVPAALAQEVFDRIAKFAAYGFNKSHAVEYALISYQTMYVKQHYPVEFWAGVLTMVKEDRRDACLADMGRMGIRLLPPDVNNSGVTFVALNDAVLLAPFSALKGLSDRTAAAIVQARESGGPFQSMQDFEERCGGRNCTSRQREILDRVGAFARIEPGQKPADDPSRRADQVEFLQGLVSEAVIVDRPLDLSDKAMESLDDLVNGWRGCTLCELAGKCHPRSYLNGPARVMLVVDGPNYREEADDELGRGSHVAALEQALEGVGLTLNETYLTALIKSPKPEKSKVWPTKTLAECPVWLEREIEVLKPPVVVVLGSLTFKHFFPGMKGGINEHAGRVIYDKGRKLNFLIGINPNAIHFDASKQNILNGVIAKLPDILPFA
jgi:DNA polymerase-3 subunit alpha